MLLVLVPVVVLTLGIGAGTWIGENSDRILLFVSAPFLVGAVVFAGLVFLLRHRLGSLPCLGALGGIAITLVVQVGMGYNVITLLPLIGPGGPQDTQTVTLSRNDGGGTDEGCDGYAFKLSRMAARDPDRRFAYEEFSKVEAVPQRPRGTDLPSIEDPLPAAEAAPPSSTWTTLMTRQSPSTSTSRSTTRVATSLRPPPPCLTEVVARSRIGNVALSRWGCKGLARRARRYPRRSP